MQELKPIKEGKVREIYDNGDSLIMVATDRISCFDVILNNEVTKKGTVLTQMSKFWFDLTEDILPNHMISVDTKDMPEFFQQEKYEGKSMMCRKLNMLPIECIVRGYITGSGWASYQENGTVCGITLPEGLRESDKLPGFAEELLKDEGICPVCGHHHDDDDDDCDHDHEHHHHHADDVFTSWGVESAKTYTKEEITAALEALSDAGTYGMILRAKGIVPAEDGTWIHFDYVPGTPDVHSGSAGTTGRLCVIGSGIQEKALAALFRAEA